MKSINNLNTLNALIRDEDMASREYYLLAKGKYVPVAMQKTLLKMSQDEATHRMNLLKYKKYLEESK